MLLISGGPTAPSGPPPSATSVLMYNCAICGWLGNPAQVTKYTIMSYNTLDAEGYLHHALLNGLAAL